MNLLSLFSGCGGMDLGFSGGFTTLAKSVDEVNNNEWIDEHMGNFVKLKSTKFKTVFANDIRNDAKIAWSNYFSKNKKNPSDLYYTQSIVDLVEQAKNGKFEFPQNIDVVTDGFPCQDFSVAGKRLGFNSTKSHTGEFLDEEANVANRGQLYIWMKEVITLTKPKIFIAENVKGLTNLKDVKEVIEHDFERAGGVFSSRQSPKCSTLWCSAKSRKSYFYRFF